MHPPSTVKDHSFALKLFLNPFLICTFPSRLYAVDLVESPVFEEAVSRLVVAPRVALAGQGELLGRGGVLSLLGLATTRDIFIFDVLMMGMEGFKYGLWAVLRRRDLVKVVHDVRQLSDLLHHQFEVTLENVFDTLAAHLVTANWREGPRRERAVAPSFGSVVRRHLGIELEVGQVEGEEWRRRALAPSLLLAAARPLALLLALGEVLESRLGDPVRGASLALVTGVREEQDDRVVEQLLLSPHITPDSMVVVLPQWMRKSSK